MQQYNEERKSPANIHRPDADGYLTLKEANEWYRVGNGEPLNVDLSKLNLSRISANDFDKVGSEKYFNLASLRYASNLDDSLVYGNIKLKLNTDGSVSPASHDIYNFDMKPWNSPKNIIRNIQTKIGSIYAGDGVAYRINFYGKGKLGE